MIIISRSKKCWDLLFKNKIYELWVFNGATHYELLGEQKLQTLKARDSERLTQRSPVRFRRSSSPIFFKTKDWDLFPASTLISIQLAIFLFSAKKEIQDGNIA